MKFISLYDGLKAMAQFAPHNWCKWAILGMVHAERIRLYSSSGRVKSYTTAGALNQGDAYLDEIGEGYRSNKSMAIPSDITRDYGLELPDYKNLDWDVIVPLSEWSWGEASGPLVMSSGYSFWGEVDWTGGTITLDEFNPEPEWAIMFQNDEIVEDGIDVRLIHDFHIAGICFDYEEFALIAPQCDLESLTQKRKEPLSLAGNRGGRPPRWNWPDAFVSVIAVANTPDGLPDGPGAQAFVERILADHFVKTTGGQPSISQIREYASKIMHSIGR